MLIVASEDASAGDAARGADLFALAAGCNCHTPAGGPIGAGGGEVPTPFGTFYGTNITPDPETGIGRWTDAEIAAAIRDGDARDRGVEAPAMPYYQYAGMSDADVADLVAYLRSLPPVVRENQPHEGELPLARWAYWFWRLLFAPSVSRPETAPTEGLQRGRYLADHVAICTDCHTPRNALGVPAADRYLAGASPGPAGQAAPNLTPHSSGIADWSVDDIMNLLALGMLPNFDNVQGLMGEAIDGRGGGPGYKDGPEGDRRLIAEYLRTVAPIDNVVGAK